MRQAVNTMRRAVAGVASMALAAGSAAAQAPRAAELQAALTAWAAQPGHFGVSAAVIFGDGREWTGAAGNETAGAPIRTEHFFWLASITKTMTGAVILQLVEEGRLTLDAPVGRWLPAGSRIDPRITVRQLMNHTSGVPVYDGGALVRSQTDRAHVWTAEELLAAVGPPLFAPGARTQYTNTAFVLLARIAEQVTGRPIAQLLRERLWVPQGLTEIFMIGHESPAGPVARTVGPAGAVQPLDTLSLTTAGHGAGAVFATARTVARWGRALFTGSVVTAESQRALRTLVPAAGNIPGESGAGLGVRGYNFLGRQQLGHSGGAILGNSLMVHDISTGCTVVVLTNQGRGADHFVLAPQLLEIATRP